MAGVVAFFETLLAHDAGRILFAVLAAPGNITVFEDFAAEAHTGGTLIDLLNN